LIKSNKYTKEDLKQMQEWDIYEKINTTQFRMLEWYKRFKGKVYVSFSGGKDSTVLVDLAARLCRSWGYKLILVYVDTGLEYPEIKSFVNEFRDWCVWRYEIEIELVKLKPEKSFREIIIEHGYPVISKEVAECVRHARNGSERALKNFEGIDKNGDECQFKRGMYSKYKYLIDAPFPISERCCDYLKKDPFAKYEAETGNKPILATMASESRLREFNYLKSGCNNFDGKHPASTPMGFWTAQDVLFYLKRWKIPYANIYGDIAELPNGKLKTTGCQRTGCIFCMFGAHLEKEPNRFQLLKTTHSNLWEYCMKPIEQGGLGIRDVLEYINIPAE
jgi:3'-phosphoadenosine 5'-phosphosulfate sulfotransferase (PAPS reductase)/FAD synthetase